MQKYTEYQKYILQYLGLRGRKSLSRLRIFGYVYKTMNLDKHPRSGGQYKLKFSKSGTQAIFLSTMEI